MRTSACAVACELTRQAVLDLHARAHDALSDALTTLELCRLVFQRSPELWQRFVRFANKATVADFVDAEDGFVLSEFFGGQAYHTAVVCIGRDPDQANGRLCLNLDEDIERLAAMSDMEMQARLAEIPSPIRRLRINAAPTRPHSSTHPLTCSAVARSMILKVGLAG